MANIFNAKVIVHPSFIEPENILTTAQASGFMDVLAGRAPRVRLGPVDKFVYQNRIDIRSAVATTQASYNALQNATLRAEYVQTATYRVFARAEYDDLDVLEAGEWNVALPEAQRLAMRQGIFQFMRDACLYGVNAANSEGLLNTPNATAVNLPPDSFGNTNLSTYDAGQLSLWFLQQIQAAFQRLYMLGLSSRCVILGPQRVLGQMQLANIVQVTSYQRPGSGTATTAQVIQKVAEENGYAVEYAFDDTLIGKGSAGSDAVLLVVPEVIVPKMNSINTNVFNTLAPNLAATTLMYSDVVAPIEITTPIPKGLDVVSQIRISSGWCPRGQAISILSLPY